MRSNLSSHLCAVIQRVSCGSASFRDPDERSLLLHNIDSFFSLTAELEMHINTWRYFATGQWKRLTHALDCFNTSVGGGWTLDMMGGVWTVAGGRWMVVEPKWVVDTGQRVSGER